MIRHAIAKVPMSVKIIPDGVNKVSGRVALLDNLSLTDDN